MRSPTARAPALEERRESGVALLATVLLLLMLASLGFASLNVVERDQQVAGYLNRKGLALLAADAAIARALEQMDATGTPAVPAANLGDPAVYPHGQPSYQLDTTAADPIDKLGTGNPPGFGLQVGAGPKIQYWRIRVQGEAPGGSVARVEVLTGSLVAN